MGKPRKLPWNRLVRDEVPRHRKIRLTLHYLLSYPWHRLRCRNGRATPLTRFSALRLRLRQGRTPWHHGIPVGELTALTIDPNPRVRSRAAEAFPDSGKADGPRELAEGLPVEAAAELAHLIGKRPGHIDKAENLSLAWRLWLVHGDERLWGRLVRHGKAVSDEPLCTIGRLALGQLPTEELRSGAADPAVPWRARARAAEHLKAEGAVTDDPLEAAPFYVMAGLMPEYRRIDPDGSLLSLAYAAMDADQRSRLRTVLSDLGELDLVRTLSTATRARTTIMDDDGGAPGDSSRLFTACLSAPCLGAVTTVARLRDWAPTDPEDRALLDRLSRADPQELRFARDQLAGTRELPIEPPGDRIVVEVGSASFSPDGSRVAVAMRLYGSNWWFFEYDTASGELLSDQYAYYDGSVAWLVHTGSGLASVYGFSDLSGAPMVQFGFSRDGETRILAEHTHRIWETSTLERLRDGFMFHDGTGMRAFDATGNPIPGEQLGITGGPGNGTIRQFDADPSTGHIAVVTENHIRIHEPQIQRTLNFGTARFSETAALFLDHTALVSIRDVSAGRFAVTRWTLDRKTINDGFTAEHEVSADVRSPGKRGRMYRLADGNRILIAVPRGRYAQPSGENMITLDATTLERDHISPQVGCRILAASPDTRTFLCAAGRGEVPRLSLRNLTPHPLARLVDTPMAEMTPSDLAFVERELDRATSTERPLVELLYHCLRHRFGGDIALGEPGVPAVTDYDIHLGGDQ